MRRSESANKLADQAAEKALSVTFYIPARALPAAGIVVAVATLLSSVCFNLYYGHDIGGIWWPYISDTAKDPPQCGLFAFGMTLTSCMISVIVLLNYGKCKRDLYLLNKHRGQKRNKISMACGLVAAPNLGLLASYDTVRSPGLHLVFVGIFFTTATIYLFTVNSMYKFIRHTAKHAPDLSLVERDRFRRLNSSCWAKQMICTLYVISTSFYLPVGMCLVSDWYDYSNDVLVHTFRAVWQHISVLCLIFFFGTFWYDFGEMNVYMVQV